MARLTTPQLQSQLRANLASGTSLGTFIGISSSIPYELAELAGFDWVISDLEHGENELAQVATAVISFLGPVIARVPSAAPENISRVLDRGAAGVMIPRVNSMAMLTESLGALDYPPKGIRGVASYNRSAKWGHDATALENASPVAVIQLETAFAVEQIDEICSVDRIDALFIGPLDLSFALGVPRQFESEIFVNAVEKMLQSAKNAGIPIGILANSEQTAKDFKSRGFDFLALGSDTTSLLGAFKDQVAALKKN